MDALADPNWPGPNYYKDCKMFSWKEVLVKNHKAYFVNKGQTYPDYKKMQEKADADALQKLYAKLDAKWLSNLGVVTAGLAQIFYYTSF